MQDDLKLSQAGAAALPGTGRHADLRAFHAHWAEARRGAAVPYRAHIDPRRIAPLLADTFVAERIAPGLTRLRIAGMNLSDLMGMEVRGMPLSSFIAPASREAFALHMVDLFDRPATLRMALWSKGGTGRPELRGTLVLLPLRSDLGDVSRALGCLLTTGAAGRETGRTPRRFEIVHTRITPVNEDGDADGATGEAATTGTLHVVAGGLSAQPLTRDTRSSRDHLRLVT
jgi:hypothetical protein